MQQKDDDNNNNFTAHKPKSKKNNSFEEFTTEYAKIGKKPAVRKSKIGGEGEIIQVPGGHIIRATGGKDRHSKVYTSKGPRDRRVRLSANTAIQFYDVQDRLGYDRPSKAVDWLMNKAKEAIDKLEGHDLPINHKEVKMDHHSPNDFNPGSKSVQEMDLEQQQESANIRYAFQLQRHLGGDLNANSGIMANQPAGAAAGATQSMADSMKSFFPLNPGTSLMEMQSYPHNNNRISRVGIQSEDLGLLLQTQNHQNQRAHDHTADHEMLLQHHQGSNSVSYDENYTKPESWNNLGVQEEENRVGFIFNPINATNPQQLFSSQNTSEREPLQSNYSQLLHSWNERMLPSMDQQQNVHPTIQPCSYNLYFGSNFQVPPQIHGEEEEEDQEDHSH